jgi:hypothetical protein
MPPPGTIGKLLSLVSSSGGQVYSLLVVVLLGALFDGRRLRALPVGDNYTRESLAIEVGQNLKGEDVVNTLNCSAAKRGLPAIIEVDNVLNARGEKPIKSRILFMSELESYYRC